MGASKSTLSSQRRLPKYGQEKERHEYIKNLNKYDDSDYDDELDSQIDSKDDIDDEIVKKASLHGDGKEFYDDMNNEDKDNDTKNLLPKGKVFAEDDSVAQIDNSALDIQGSNLGDADRAKSPGPGRRGGSKARLSKASLAKVDFSTVKKEDKTKEPDNRDPRSVMDPQQEKSLIADLQRLQEFGEVKANAVGLLSFNRFMHIFILITRHSKEQFIKEQRKVIEKRRRAFRLKAWSEYSKIVQHEIDIERIKYLDVVNYVLNFFEIQDGCYRSSFMKYSMNRERDLQMKDARQLVIKDVERRHLDQIEFNQEMIEKDKCIKMLGFYEARKLDVLQILSNPFKHQFDKQKEKFVLDLAVEQAKIEDQIYIKFGHEFLLFIKACRNYGLMKNGKTDMHKDAMVIGNSLNINI